MRGIFSFFLFKKKKAHNFIDSSDIKLYTLSVCTEFTIKAGVLINPATYHTLVFHAHFVTLKFQHNVFLVFVFFLCDEWVTASWFKPQHLNYFSLPHHLLPHSSFALQLALSVSLCVVLYTHAIPPLQNKLIIVHVFSIYIYIGFLTLTTNTIMFFID